MTRLSSLIDLDPALASCARQRVLLSIGNIFVCSFVVSSQQLQVLKSAGKVSSVSSLGGGEKVSLVNVRDVVQFMPQIRYMMSRLDGSGELSHAHSSKRQRVS